MPYVRLGDGLVAHVRMARPRRRRCCGREGSYPCPTPATQQCDFLVAPGRTCSAWICVGHAKHVGRDQDLCPDHAGAAGLFTGLETMKKEELPPAPRSSGAWIALNLAIDALSKAPPTGEDWPVNWAVIVRGLKELQASLPEHAQMPGNAA